MTDTHQIDKGCITCFSKTYKKLHEKFNTYTKQKAEFDTFFQDQIQKCEFMSAPEIQRILNREFCRLIGVGNPYKEEKQMSNEAALELYEEWKPKVEAASDSFDLALRLAIAGNIMDYGANNDFDLHQTIEQVLKVEFTKDQSAALKAAISEAKLILYLGDNAGEIVFDKLFIETQIKADVVFAVKDSPILNDVTFEDARLTGMDKVAKIISNGFDAPSTVLSACSPEFLDIYRKADLIISKGQGNYEGLMYETDPRIFFLLMAKCDVIGEMLGVPKGSFVVSHINEAGRE